MTLSFTTQINGKPTFFIEKIWKYFHKGGPVSLPSYYSLLTNEQRNKIEEVHPKITTIREDQKNRWYVGCKIHFVINNRTPSRFQFLPVIICKGVQKVEIEHWTRKTGDKCDPVHRYISVRVDNRFLTVEEIDQLALNDGFDSTEDFFNYFNSNFEGKIIHWTDLKY